MIEILRHPSFRRLFLAHVVSLVGTGLATVALALLAYDLAGDRGCGARHRARHQDGGLRTAGAAGRRVYTVGTSQGGPDYAGHRSRMCGPGAAVRY